jgi:hypothetical protein
MTGDWTGGCACGAVRYRLASDPFDAGWCHCRTCQLNSGSPAMAFASVPAGDFQFIQGEDAIGRFASSEAGHRLFCTRCGTPLLMRDNDQPSTIDFSLATLDQPERIVPGFHIFYNSHIAWAPAADDAIRYPGFRRDGIGDQA